MSYFRLTENTLDTTKLSSKGQVVLPKSIRAARNWKPGLELVVEETPEGVLLRPLKPFSSKTIDDVFGSARYKGPSKSVEEMHEAVVAESRKRKRK